MTALPDAVTIHERLCAIGIEVDEGFDLDSALDAAMLDFALMTDRPWFFGECEPSSVRYTPPSTRSGEARLSTADYIDVSEVVIGYVNELESGTALEEDRDFTFIRERGQNTTIIGIDFHRHPGSLPRSVLVTGTRGFAEDCPADVREALIARAMAAYLTRGEGVVAARKLGQREERYAAGDGQDTAARLNAQFEAVAKRYRRLW